MSDLTKKARKQLEDLDIEKLLKDIDLSGIDTDAIRNIDFRGGAQQVRDQISQLDVKQREEDAAGKGFVGGVLLGALIGAILALIFAPKSGEETRHLVADKTAEMTAKAEHAVKSNKDEVDEQIIIEQDGPSTTSLNTEPAIEREIGSNAQPTSAFI